MKIHYTLHFKLKESGRSFPPTYSKKICYKPDYKFFDNDPDNMSNISVKELEYGGVPRLVVIAHTYNRSQKRVIMKTIYVIWSYQMTNWVSSGKWTRR